MTTQYPVGGPREPVYTLLRSLGFAMSRWSDKVWSSADGLEVRVFGAGSQAQITMADELKTECPLDDLAGVLTRLRRKE